MAGFDAARTTNDNWRRWEHTDGLSGDAAASPEVRRILRERVNYEWMNNPHLYGQVLIIANDVVGRRGPRLQLRSGDEVLDFAVERLWRAWAREIKLAETLRLMVKSRILRGEVFGLLHYNPELRSPVKLDLMLIESDQVATPELWMGTGDPSATDGIEFDEHGNPSVYHVLKSHPGDVRSVAAMTRNDYERIPASEMLHYFRADRPGQRRGISEPASAINLYADRRQLRNATLDAVEMQARLAAFIEQESGGEPSEPDDDLNFSELQMVRRAAMFLPPGCKPSSIKADSPNANLVDVDRGWVVEAGRSMGLPRNISTGDSSSYNYASSRSDRQNYDRATEIAHDLIETTVVDRLFVKFCIFANAAQVLPASGRRHLPTALDPLRLVDFEWIWQRVEHVDPLKNAAAVERDLANNVTTLAEVCARRGEDWQDVLRQRGAEMEAAAKHGISVRSALSGPAAESAMDVLAKLRDGAIVLDAAVELLAALGVPRSNAIVMARRTHSSANDRTSSADELRFQREVLVELLRGGEVASEFRRTIDMRKLLADLGMAATDGEVAGDQSGGELEVADDAAFAEPVGSAT
ncbi:MAG: phage portal protein [Phycisphaerales bacterium]|nr:phage portal protein [Phycisphaerales bacterium]